MPNPSTQFLWGDAVKRALDVTASLAGLILLAPLFLFVAIAIRRDSLGPVFYRGPRLGQGDKPFLILKFRTMREEAASYAGPRLTAQDDTRITVLGRWLRDTKINEFPQLWNVLKGEMSLVGPRPEDPELAVSWPADVRAEVLSVRPGITSPASVLYRDEEELLSSQTLMATYLSDIVPSKLRLDQLYVRRRSLLLDLDVLFWTFLVLIPRLKHHKPPEEFIFWGPLSRLVRRYINWFMIDTATTLLALTLTGVFWRLFAPFHLGFFPALAFVTIYSVIFSISGALSGVQRIAWRYADADDVLDLIPPTLVAGFVTLAINYFWSIFPVTMILCAAGLACAGFIITRYHQRILTGWLTRWYDLRGVHRHVRERVLIVGSGEAGQFAAWSLTNTENAGAFQVVGFVDDDLYKQQIRLRGVRVVGRRSEIPELVERHDVGVIVYAIHNISDAESQEILAICRQTRARTVVWPDVLAFVRQAVAPEKPEDVARYTGRYVRREQVSSWLDHIESQLHSGTLRTVEEQIQSIRSQLR